MRFDPDVWGTVSDWVVATTALAATLFGGYQLRLLIEARQDGARDQSTNLRVQQGLQLMEIDKQYEGVLLPSRRALASLRQQIEGSVSETDPAARFSLIRALVSENLNELRIASGGGSSARARKIAARDYFELMQLPNYLETMGVLVEEELVDQKALIRLYDGMIVRVIGDMMPHIEWRRTRDQNSSYLHFAEKLYELSLAHMRQPEP